MHRIRIKRPVAAVGVMLTVAGGALAFSQTQASAVSNLSVTLSATGTSSVHWDVGGNPVLTVGTTGSAQMQVNNPPFAAPTDAPIFASDHFAGGSPHWLLQFAGGAQLVGLPLGQGDAKPWTVTGPCTNGADSYVNQLAFIQKNNCGGAVTGAKIVADSGQAAGTSDTITSIQYAGMTLVGGSDVVTVTSPGNQSSTLGVAITPLQLTASSNKGDAIASWSASGLPTGLSIDTAKGIISGTPTATGTFSVTVSAVDNGGTKGSVAFTWTVSTSAPPPHVTYSGTIRLYKMGLCLDDALNSSHNGAIVQVWRCNGMSNQNWQVMSDGTIRHNGLCLDARDFGTTNGTKIQLWSCTGGPNQQWDTRGFRVHYDNPHAFNKVLDDTAFGGNGTRQELYTNVGSINQQWATF